MRMYTFEKNIIKIHVLKHAYVYKKFSLLNFEKGFRKGY